MSLNRWKVLACTLTVGVGGLAMFATDPTPTKADPAKEPAPLPNLTVKPTSPSNGTDTPAPILPVKAEEFELTVPVVPPVKPAAPIVEPVLLPDVPILVPAKIEVDAKKNEPKKPEAEKPSVIFPPPPVITHVKDAPKAVAPIIAPAAKVEAPKPPAIDLDIPPITRPPADPVAPPPFKGQPIEPIEPVAPSAPKLVAPPLPEVKPTPPALVTPTPPDSVRVPLPPSKVGESTRLKMLLRMGDGQPRFEIRNAGTTELLLKVYGEKIEMQAPPDAQSTLAGVSAIGRVRFTAPGLEGTCDHLTILSGTGEVLLKGNIHLKTKHGKSSSEMTAEKMVYQIGTTGLVSQGTPRSPITPARYLPD